MLLDPAAHILSCFSERSEEMLGVCVGCMSRVGLNGPFVTFTLSFLPGSRHSSSVSYPMSLCCWDKVLFVCRWLLAGAHSALKLRLNDGDFSSLSVLFVLVLSPLCFHCTELNPVPTFLSHPPTALLAAAWVGQRGTGTKTSLFPARLDADGVKHAASGGNNFNYFCKSNKRIILVLINEKIYTMSNKYIYI